MSFTTDNLVQDGSFEVILRSDPAIEGTTDDAYAAYSKSLNASHLNLVAGQEPTYWKMSRKLKYSHKQWVDAAKIKVDRTGDFSIQIFEFMTREVRASLEGIKSPESVPVEKRLETIFKKTGDGLVAEEFTVALGDLVSELFTVRQAYLEAQKSGKADLKKG
jgi:hypothetical protein